MIVYCLLGCLFFSDLLFVCLFVYAQASCSAADASAPKVAPTVRAAPKPKAVAKVSAAPKANAKAAPRIEPGEDMFDTSKLKLGCYTSQSYIQVRMDDKSLKLLVCCSEAAAVKTGHVAKLLMAEVHDKLQKKAFVSKSEAVQLRDQMLQEPPELQLPAPKAPRVHKADQPQVPAEPEEPGEQSELDLE